jgi:hypothetical protein
VIASPRGLPFDGGMGTKSREAIYRASVRRSAEQAAEAPRVADHLACVAWSQRMFTFQGPAQPSRPLVTPSTAAIPISKSSALAARPNKQWHSTLFAGRTRPRSMSLSDTCAASTVHERADAHSSAAIRSCRGRRKYPHSIRRQHGGRAALIPSNRCSRECSSLPPAFVLIDFRPRHPELSKSLGVSTETSKS